MQNTFVIAASLGAALSNATSLKSQAVAQWESQQPWWAKDNYVSVDTHTHTHGDDGCLIDVDLDGIPDCVDNDCNGECDNAEANKPTSDL